MTDNSGAALTRRRLLGGAAVAGGAAAASLALPTNVRKALAAQPKSRPAARLSDIKHVVLLMQENRSFDHYFGTLSGVRGFGDPDALRLSTGRTVFYQPDKANPKGYLLPYHLDSRTSAAQAMPSTSHAWDVQHQAWNNGRMDNWLPAHRAADGEDVGPFTMGYFTRDDIPFQYALADAFTICDNYFCSVLGPTSPNRYMWMTGTIDPDGRAGGPALDNNVRDGSYFWESYNERLLAAGVDFRCYHDGNLAGYNILQNMKQYQSAPTTSELYKRTLTEEPEGQFEFDALNDRLPAISWLFPPTTELSEHPAGMPAAGASFVARKIDAIATNPDVWAKTVFILTYDENDGLFDHVQPPVPPRGTPEEFVKLSSPTGVPGDNLPVGPGFRVPTMIVSPWTSGGYVCSEAFDHTSCLRFLEKWTGVAAPNISAYRRRTLGDLTSAFRFHAPNDTPPVLPDTAGQLALANYETANLPMPEFPGGAQTPPAQEKGKRKRVG